MSRVDIIPGILALSTAVAIALGASSGPVNRPAGVPACKPPWTFMIINGWECIGGPGPVILPTPDAATPAVGPATTGSPASVAGPAPTAGPASIASLPPMP
jgi:hypothetical protein